MPRPFLEYPERVHAEQHPKPRMSYRGLLAGLLLTLVWGGAGLLVWRYA